MTPECKFRELYEEMYSLCEENGWGDPFSGGRAKEIHMASLLGHEVSDTYSGADGYDEDGGCEYKSTVSSRMNATYNAISLQATWEKQVEYMREEKIAKYTNHYHARYDGATCVELWKMSGKKVLELLTPKVERAYRRMKTGGKNKDPRLGATLCQMEIRTYGERLI